MSHLVGAATRTWCKGCGQRRAVDFDEIQFWQFLERRGLAIGRRRHAEDEHRKRGEWLASCGTHHGEAGEDLVLRLGDRRGEYQWGVVVVRRRARVAHNRSEVACAVEELEHREAMAALERLVSYGVAALC